MNTLHGLVLLLCLSPFSQQSELSMPSAPIIVQAEKQPAPNGPPAVNLPPDFSVGVGRLAKIVASSNGKQIKWVIASDAADLIASESGAWAIFASPNPGKYMILAWTAIGDVPSDAATCWITVGTPGPPPPPPPPPTPPEPTDAWYLPLKTAYLTETPTDKLSLPLLATNYRYIATQAQSATGTAKQFHDTVVSFLSSSVGTALPKTRAAAGKLLDTVLPQNPAQAMDAATKQTVASAYSRLASMADALGRLK